MNGAGMTNAIRDTSTLFVFSVTLFLSASLMFAVQPMVGRMLLPLVGGSPSGWLVALAFFQTALLTGYFLAWALSRLKPRVHGAVFLFILAASIYLLPITTEGRQGLIGTVPGAFDVLVLLCVMAGVPFVALSATSSTLQRLFTVTRHESAEDPYFLYAASNIGSMIGLFGYPLLIEPFYALNAQSVYWASLFVVLVFACAICLLLTLRSGVEEVPLEGKAEITRNARPITWKRRAHWFALAFVPSSLLLGVTSHITTDIMALPMIWVVPLGLYLLTHILAFSKTEHLPKDGVILSQPYAVAISLSAGTVLIMNGVGMGQIALQLWAFFVVAQMCHTLLADDRPAADRLGEFYFWLAAGGAAGGVTNAFIVPVVFDKQVEFMLVMIASCALNPNFMKDVTKDHYVWALRGVAGLAIYFLVYALAPKFLPLAAYLFMIALCLLGIHPRFMLVAGFFILLTTSAYTPDKIREVHTSRNFFGTINVFDTTVIDDDGKTTEVRVFKHGTTLHGLQILSDADAVPEPASYYVKFGPVGDMFDSFDPKDVGVLGLGAGGITCHTAPGRHFTYYEIDPAVVTAAKRYFDFLDTCGTDKLKIIVGDGRLELAKRDVGYDMLFMDAFSSDSVPIHLLTREAVALYIEKLAEGGVIAIHISNRFFDFSHPIATVAQDLSLQHRFKTYPGNGRMVPPSAWMVLAREETDLSALDEKGWEIVKPPVNARVWTDQYSNILSALRL